MTTARARELRQSMTRQEVKLWVRLRELRGLGFHFRRQSPIGRYIVDFECRRRRVIVEADGNQHGYDSHQMRDDIRDRTLTSLGYRVLRFGNGDIETDIEGVLEVIHQALTGDLNDPHPTSLSRERLHSATLPEVGEG
jgi:very-short-patch-repair endonuclease